jgi:hypothetical protein
MSHFKKVASNAGAESGLRMEPTEFWLTHAQRTHPNFCKAYSAWRRIHHHHHYLVCLFSIEKKE